MATEQSARERAVEPANDPEGLAQDPPLKQPQKSYQIILKQHVAPVCAPRVERLRYAHICHWE